MSLRIALDCSSAARPESTGVAMYVRRMVEAFARVDREDAFTLVYRFSRIKNRGSFIAPPAANFRSKLMIERLHPIFARRMQVFHGLDARIPGRWMKAKLVVTIHDVYSALQSKDFATQEFREMKDKRYRDLAERADRIVVVSEASRRDVLETLRPDPAKLRVVYEAGGPGFVPQSAEAVAAARRKHGLDRPYLIYVGTVNRRKNLPNMIKAFALARKRAKSDAVFAIAGRVGFGGEEIHHAIDDADARGAVKMLGYVPDSDVAPLYAGAWGLLFATLYEGFGIPVVEAFGCGCPVIGGKDGSVPEIVAGAGLIADPKDVESIAAAIEKILTDEALRASLKTKGLARAKDFSWDKAARSCLGIYRELI
ncbi:MAG: glycosyltransferase family 4 protein [Planctomycetota bacterium]|nr:glycosyltransferase family 4 protein [Planctomycetota bacterium]